MRTLSIEPGSPWEDGYLASFHGKLRDELLNGELFDTLLEAQVLVQRWRKHYNQARPSSALGYRPPAGWKRPPEANSRIAHINGEVLSGDGKKLSAGASPQALQQAAQEAPDGWKQRGAVGRELRCSGAAGVCG